MNIGDRYKRIDYPFLSSWEVVIVDMNETHVFYMYDNGDQNKQSIDFFNCVYEKIEDIEIIEEFEQTLEFEDI